MRRILTLVFFLFASCSQLLLAQDRDDFGTSWSFGSHSTLDLFYLYYVMAGVSTQRHVPGLGYKFNIRQP